jgi:HEAT repeat protein
MTVRRAFAGQCTLSIFSVHAPQDASYQHHLAKHLSPLKRQGAISIWSVDDIPAGADRALAMKERLSHAQIILLLISADFVASDDLYESMMYALQRREEGHTHVIPIQLRPLDWETLPVSQLPALPSNGRSVTNWSDRDEAFAHITQGIRKLVHALNHTTDERTLTQAHLDYLHWLIKRTALLDMRGITSVQRRPLQVKLEEVYITPNAILEDFQAEQPSPLTLAAEPSNQATPQLLSRVVSLHDHLVILGEPGSGKTTFLRYLALNHAQALRDDRDTDMGETRFPILLRIADYVQYGMHQGKSLSDYLADDCTRHECALSQLPALLKAELQAGRCLILLDGLDEVIHGDDRRMVVERLEDFVRGSDEVPNRFIVTSRSAGYLEAPLNDVFAHYTLRELEETDMRCLLESWYRAGEASDEETASMRVQQAKRETNELMNAIQTVPGVRRLAANPLLLRILAQLHHEGKPLPRQRGALYEQVTETLIKTWRVAQGVSTLALSEASPLLDYTFATRLLSRFAYWLHNESSGGSTHEREACEELGREWARLTNRPWHEENPDSEKEIKQFLLAVRDHTGILIEDPPHHYQFAHLTFEEYYAARHLVANREERAKRIRAHLHDPRWQEPILLALGLIGRESPEQVPLLVETVILAQGEQAISLGLAPSPYEPLLGRDYLMALRCLGDDIPVHPALVSQLIKRCLREITGQTASGRFQKYQEVLIECLKHIEASIYASALLPHLIKNLQGTDRNLRIWSLYSLGRIYRASLSTEARRPLLEALHDDDPWIRSAALLGLSHMQGPELTELLLNVLSNENDFSVRREAIKYLGERGQTSQEVTRTLLDVLREPATPDGILLRDTVVKSLGQLGDASREVISALIALLPRDTLFLLRQFSHESTLQSLQQLSQRSSEVVPMIVNALQDAEPHVRVAVASTLETFASASPEVIALLRHVPSEPSSSETLQVPICAKQWCWLPDQVEALLLRRLRNSRAFVRWEAVKALGQLEELSDRAENALVNVLHDEDALVRARAIETFNTFEMSTNTFITFIQMLSNDTDAYVRARIVGCLGDMDQPSQEVLPALLGALHDTEDHVRCCAVESLGHMIPHSPEILTALLTVLRSDTFFGARWAVIKSLKDLGELPASASLATIQTLLEDTHQVVRQDCAHLLGQSGSSDEQTIQALLKGLSDGDLQVRQACSQALVRLGQRFPERRDMITLQLERIIQERQDESVSWFGLSTPCDMAYDALWLLVKGDPLESE